MLLQVVRVKSDDEATLGELWVDGVRRFVTLEDQFQAGEKVYGETRIPTGRYRIGLKTDGEMHQAYMREFTFHRGMLHVQGVLGFEGILIHYGNFDCDTKGCVLVGRSAGKVTPDHLRMFPNKPLQVGRMCILKSKDAYAELYEEVAQAIERREDVRLEIIDEDDNVRVVRDTGASRPGAAAATTAGAGAVVIAGSQLGGGDDPAAPAPASPPAYPGDYSATQTSALAPASANWFDAVDWNVVMLVAGLLTVAFAVYLLVHRVFDWRRYRGGRSFRR